MILLIKIAVVLTCAVIAFQDIKDRMVLWMLFPLFGIFLGLLYLSNCSFEQFYPLVLTNIILISTVILVLFLYTKYIVGMKFLNASFGLGDLLFFYALALGFPTVTFLILFVSSILFALFIFLIQKNKKENETIPLAGFMSLFVIVVLLTSFFPNTPSLYIL